MIKHNVHDTVNCYHTYMKTFTIMCVTQNEETDTIIILYCVSTKGPDCSRHARGRKNGTVLGPDRKLKDRKLIYGPRSFKDRKFKNLRFKGPCKFKR